MIIKFHLFSYDNTLRRLCGAPGISTSHVENNGWERTTLDVLGRSISEIAAGSKMFTILHIFTSSKGARISSIPVECRIRNSTRHA